jgi:tetratricopeptide (TPR) repeat protein
MRALTLISLLVITVSANAQNTNSEIEKGIKLLEQQNWEESIKVFLGIIDADENNAEAHFHVAYSYYRLGDLDEAIEHAERSVELEEDNAKYHFRLGELYSVDAQDASIFRAPGLASDLKEQFERVLELDSLHIGARIALAQFYFHAPGIVGGDIDKALEHAQIVADLDEKQGHFLLSQIYESEGRNEEAENELKFLEGKFGNDPDFYYFYNVYGYFLMNQDRIDEAMEKFKKQVALAPDKYNPYDSLGDAYRRKGMLKEALAEYRKAVQINPEFESSLKAIEEIEEELE